MFQCFLSSVPWFGQPEISVVKAIWHFSSIRQAVSSLLWELIAPYWFVQCKTLLICLMLVESAEICTIRLFISTMHARRYNTTATFLEWNNFLNLVIFYFSVEMFYVWTSRCFTQNVRHFSVFWRKKEICWLLIKDYGIQRSIRWFLFEKVVFCQISRLKLI